MYEAYGLLIGRDNYFKTAGEACQLISGPHPIGHGMLMPSVALSIHTCLQATFCVKSFTTISGLLDATQHTHTYTHTHTCTHTNTHTHTYTHTH